MVVCIIKYMYRCNIQITMILTMIFVFPIHFVVIDSQQRSALYVRDVSFVRDLTIQSSTLIDVHTVHYTSFLSFLSFLESCIRSIMIVIVINHHAYYDLMMMKSITFCKRYFYDIHFLFNSFISTHLLSEQYLQ